jgi:hypothetical protein
MALHSSDFEPSDEDISFVQKEDKTNKVIMMMDANANILDSLDKSYNALMNHEDFELKDNERCKKALADFSLQLRDFVHDFQMHASRPKTLGRITADRKNLVSGTSSSIYYG